LQRPPSAAAEDRNDLGAGLRDLTTEQRPPSAAAEDRNAVSTRRIGPT